MTASHLESNSELMNVQNMSKKESGEDSTSLNTKETEAENLKRKESDWNKAEGLPCGKFLKTSEVGTRITKTEYTVTDEIQNRITSKIRAMRVRRPSHRVPWKQYGVLTYNKQIFDFFKSAKNRKKKEIKRKKRNKTKCTIDCGCQEKVEKVKETMKSNEFTSKLNELTLQQKTYVVKLVENIFKKLHGEKFTMEEKLMCLSIYKKSEIVYEYLSTFLTLPKVLILKKLMRAVQFDTGIRNAMINRLKVVARKKRRIDKVVVLMFGSVSLQPHLNYNPKLDKILGFEDWGDYRSKKFADEALVFVIRGVDCEWTLPVAYSFYDEKPKVSRVVKLYKEVVEAVKEAGFNIIASVCDQGESNEAALEKLRTETVKKRGPNFASGTILVHGVKIVPLFNPSELLTDLRNNLVSKDLEFCLDSKKRPAKWDHERELNIKKSKERLVASWAHIELAYCKDSVSKLNCEIPKLTEKHIYNKELEKSDVDYVIDVFSENVAKNLDALSQNEGKSEIVSEKVHLPPEGYYTSYIVNFFKKLSETINGGKKEDFGYEKKTLLTNDSFHHEFFETAKEELRHMGFIDRETQEPVDEKIPCLENLIMTVEGFQVLWKKLNKLGFQFLKTRVFNLEPFDDFSNKNANLTCQKFARNFKTFCYLDITV